MHIFNLFYDFDIYLHKYTFLMCVLFFNQCLLQLCFVAL